MDTFLTDMVSRLGVLDVAVLMAAGIGLLYFAFSNRVLALMFMLVLSAALVSSTIPIIEDVASLLRWLTVLLLLLAGLLFSKPRISLETALFWGYVFFGLVSMLRAISITWQLQRGLLLLLVAVALPLVYSSRSYRTHRATLVSIGVVGALFAALNAAALPADLADAGRSVAYTKSAPSLAVAMGGLLPFVFWAAWHVRPRALKGLLALGLLAGGATMVLSGQRAGTLAGIISLIPMTLMLIRGKGNRVQLMVLAGIIVLLGFGIVQFTSPDKISFLTSRYRLDAGLSDRNLLWEIAFAEISKSPLVGRGIGASEWIISASFHNAYLEVWFNAGFVGLILFIAAQVYFFFRIRFLNRRLAHPESKSVLALALGYLMGFVFLSLFESVGAGASNLSLILYLYLGVLVSGRALFDAEAPGVSFAGYTPGASFEPAPRYERPLSPSPAAGGLMPGEGRAG